MRACKAALGKTRLSAVLTQRQPACNGSWLAFSSINMGHAEYACTHLRLPIVSILSTAAWRSKARGRLGNHAQPPHPIASRPGAPGGAHERMDRRRTAPRNTDGPTRSRGMLTAHEPYFSTADAS